MRLASASPNPVCSWIGRPASTAHHSRCLSSTGSDSRDDRRPAHASRRPPLCAPRPRTAVPVGGRGRGGRPRSTSPRPHRRRTPDQARRRMAPENPDASLPSTTAFRKRLQPHHLACGRGGQIRHLLERRHAIGRNPGVDQHCRTGGPHASASWPLRVLRCHVGPRDSHACPRARAGRGRGRTIVRIARPSWLLRLASSAYADSVHQWANARSEISSMVT